MRLVMIATEKLPVPPVRGGAIQTYIEGVLPYLKEYLTVTVLGVVDPALPDEEWRDGVRFVRVPGKDDALRYQEEVASFLASEPFDIIEVFNRPRLIARLEGIQPEARRFLSMHNDMFREDKLDRETAHAVVEQVDGIITVSDYIGRTIENAVPDARSRLRTIYSGVDVERFIPGWTRKGVRRRHHIRENYGLEGRPVILLVSRLSKAKGIHVVIEAMETVARRFPDAVLVVVGSKWYGSNVPNDYVRAVLKQGKRLGDRVLFTQFVSPYKVHELYLAGDIFVCASQWLEPLARVHYEAMAAGLPIITTNRGGNPEVVTGWGNGLVIDEWDDPNVFANAISWLLKYPHEARQMGERGRELAETYYGWDRVAGEVLEVLFGEEVGRS